MDVFRGKPSPAVVVAVCALAFAMVGTAVAGTDGLSQKITKSKVKKIADRRIDKAASGLSVANADNLGGQPPSAFASSSAVRYGFFTGDGELNAGLSSGISQANVSTDGVGKTCIDGLNPPPKSANVSLDFAAPFKAQIYAEVNPDNGSGYCTGSQVLVATYAGDNGFLDTAFYVALFN